MVELWPGKNYPRPAIQTYVTIIDFEIVAGEEISRTMDILLAVWSGQSFLDHPYPYQPQIVAENYLIVSKGWMRRELERY